jgi:cell division septal protein FtsQ
MRRNVLNSPRLTELKKHRRKTIFNKILLCLLGLFAIFFLFAYLSRLNTLNISEIQITGNKVVDTEAIKAVVEGQIAGKYLWLFPKSNIFFYPENNIKHELWNKFKRINNINLSINNNKIMEISLTEREAKYTWCGDSLVVGLPSGNSTTQNEQCYFVDANGYIFDIAPYFSGDVYFKFYGMANSGTYFFQQNFKQLISFKDTLITMGLKPVSLFMTNDGDIQIFLSGNTSSGIQPKIILKADADFENVAENLQAALNTEPLLSKFKNNYSKLQYIDLRFGNKVYDKFSN